MSKNPYTWHSSVKQVNMDVVGLSVFTDKGESVRLRNLTQHIVIAFPRKLGMFRLATVSHWNMITHCVCAA